MEAAAVSIEDSYRMCEQLARRSASSFYWAFWFLDREQRRSMYALYAFARRTDDVVDDSRFALAATTENARAAGPAVSLTRPSTGLLTAPSAGPMAGPSAGPSAGLMACGAALQRWRAAWQAALAGDFHDPLLPAVVDTVRRRGIPPRYLDALIAGVERDLRSELFATRAELSEYCEKVASAVGICCLHIWSDRPEPAYNAARECGLAFQLTNILRDLREDAGRGRLYLPLDELSEHQLAPGCVLAALRSASSGGAGTDAAGNRAAGNGVPCDEALIALLRRQVAIAAAHYQAGWETRRFLAPGPGRAFALMFNTYRELLDRIARDPRRALLRGTRLGAARKLWLAARACWSSPPHAQFDAVSTP